MPHAITCVCLRLLVGAQCRWQEHYCVIKKKSNRAITLTAFIMESLCLPLSVNIMQTIVLIDLTTI